MHTKGLHNAKLSFPNLQSVAAPYDPMAFISNLDSGIDRNVCGSGSDTGSG